MNPELLYQIALTMVPNIGSVQAKLLIEQFGDATSVFKAKRAQLAAVEGIGESRARCVKDFTAFDAAEAELGFIDKERITPLFLSDPAYPQRLLHCYDPPTLLYYKGEANLNAPKIVSIIGTRRNTDYGRQVTESIVDGLRELNVMVVSGLAFGIDAIAHKAAIKASLSTIGVLGHGLDTLYPPYHWSLAKEIQLHGGLLTEFMSNTMPDKHNFPKRNRIVAGMADATIVVETAAKGGSMITAELAYTYNRDVFAVPGKTTDEKSAGCLRLIQQNKAIVFTDIAQLMEVLGWDQPAIKRNPVKELFIEISEEEQVIVDILKVKEPMHIDELHLASRLSSSTVAAAILNLELQNVITCLPGKIYRLN